MKRVVFLSLIVTLLATQGCLHDDEVIKKSIDMKDPLIVLTEDSTVTVIVKSLKSFAETDTIWIQMIGGDAVYGQDFETSIAMKDNLIALVGNGKADSVSFSVTAIWDSEDENTETALFKIVDFPNGYKIGLQAEIELQIINKFDGAISFDGTDDYIDLGNIYDDLVFPFTISAWVKLDQADKSPVFASQDNYPVYNGFLLIVCWVHTTICNILTAIQKERSYGLKQKAR